MKISVIIPVYNVDLYLEECINSVIEQTFREFEIILIDDGSTDNSSKICEMYKYKFSDFIVVIRQENKGVLAARIAGINKARGEFLVFLDSDDSLREDALEVIYYYFSKYKCDMLMYDAGISLKYNSKPVRNNLLHGKIYDASSKKILFKTILKSEIPNAVWLKSIRKYNVQLTMLEQFYQVKNGEDLLMSAIFMRDYERILYIKEDLYYYRVRPGSAVHSFDVTRKESIKAVHTEIEKILEKMNFLELKPLHNARKVKGWIDNLRLLLKNKETMNKNEYKKYLECMSDDEYFRESYFKMRSTMIDWRYRFFAFCLVYKRFTLICLFDAVEDKIKKYKEKILRNFFSCC